jgi:glucose-6-phosphate isomerase
MKENPLFQQDLRFFIDSRLLAPHQHRQAYSYVLQAAQTLEKKAAQRYFPFLETPFDHSAYQSLTECAARFREFKRILIIGSSEDIASIRPLCATMQSWVGNPPEGTPHLFFLDNLDSDIFWDILSIGTSSETGLIFIAPEGEEPPLLIQLMRCIEYWRGTVSPDSFRKRYVIMTKTHNSSLQRIIKHFGLEYIPYPTHPITCFSPLALLPAMIIHFNAYHFFQGAAVTCDQFFLKILKTPLQGACLLWALIQYVGTRRHVLSCHAASFQPMLAWYQETWKVLLGPYQDVLTHIQGERNLALSPRTFFTFFLEMHTSQEALSPELWDSFPKLKILARSSLSDVMKTQFEDIRKQLMVAHQPFRILRITSLNEKALGALLMSSILEMLLLREILNNTQMPYV